MLYSHLLCFLVTVGPDILNETNSEVLKHLYVFVSLQALLVKSAVSGVDEAIVELPEGEAAQARYIFVPSVNLFKRWYPTTIH